MATVVLGAASLAALEPVLPLHLGTTQHLGPLAVGALFAAAVLAGAVLNPVIGAGLGRAGARVLVGLGGLLAAAALTGLATATQPWHTVLAMVALGASNALLMTPATTLIGYQGMHADPPALGAAYAVFNLAYAAGLFVGPALGGVLTGAAGFTAAALVLAALTVAATLGAVTRLPAVPATDRARPPS